MLTGLRFIPILALAALAVPGVPAGAEEKPASSPTTPKEEPPAAPLSFESSHRLGAGGASLNYTVRAKEIFLKDREGKPTASFFTISYSLKGTGRPEDRPVTFVFNGGPGSSSIWLHFGLVGPKLIDLPSDASDPGGPPYRLKDNPWTILRATSSRWTRSR